ncbi:hypothetical protein NA57DRAFT_52420 [Rhizodiscina lignyota]|uniref:Uncharacterized protein n=1 Tax=Rhizodiscina lignyota TaxID=1504668 RepID=A0A9P4INQ6_9PEZI|nr:hypothetical protein NA57DRAFT_52420 [Rhizodiscina lignyota]
MYNAQMNQGGQYQGQPQYGGPPQYQPPYQQHQQQQGPQYPQQQQPYAQQSQYGQQAPFQGGYQQAGPPHQPPPRHNSYPPAKRQKGNPVITRYPPPPGYRPPPPGQPFQHQTPGYQQGYQQPQAYPPQSAPPTYQHPQSWQGQGPQAAYQPQQSYQQPPNYQHPQGYQQNYPTQQGPQAYPPQQPYAPQQGYQQQSPQGYQQQGYQQPAPPHNYQQSQAPPDAYQQPPPQWQGSPQQQPSYPASDHSQYGGQQFHTPPRRDSFNRSGRNSATPTHSMQPPPASQSTHRPSSAMSMSSDPEQTKPGAANTNDPLNLGAEEWEFDGDGALWPKTTDTIDPALSIGIIIWHPATQVTRALASGSEEAAAYFAKPQPKAFGNAESVSKYFTAVNAHAAYLNIRETEHWKIIKDDPVFVEFPDEYELVAMEEVIKVRNRPDFEEDEDAMQDVKEDGEVGDGDQEYNVMDNLEQALATASNGPSPTAESKDDSESSARPGPMKVFPVDDSQEDILAKLGVTGIPKPVYPTPGPAYAPPNEEEAESPKHVEPDKAEQSHEQHQYRSPQKDTHPSYHHPPPPPPVHEPYPEPERARSPSYDPWRVDQHMPTNGRHSPARSDKSNHTVTGSDFGQDTTEGAQQTNGSGAGLAGSIPASADTQPPLARSDSSTSRKRSYDRFDDQDDGSEPVRQADDRSSKKGRRSIQGRAEGAYSRR